jgi:outer membrane receptor for ferrienterochelin and colicins
VARVAITVLHPKLVFYFNPKSSLTFNYTVTFDARKGGDINYFAANTTSNHYHVATTSTRQNADAKWLYDFSKKSNLTVKLSSSIVQQHLDTKFYAFTATQKIYYSELSYVRKRPGSDWVAGLNVNGDVFTNKTTALFAINDYSYSTLGAFVQNTWRATKHFTVESGFRTDYHSKYGFFPLPRLSLMYKFSNTITGRVNGGLGYKTANLLTYIDAETDLKHIVPGTELVSEKSQGINADVNYHKTFSKAVSLTFNQSFFYTNISSPVYDSSSSAEKVTLSNAAKSLRTQGLQTYARIQYHDIELYLGYVFTDVKKLYDSKQPQLPVTPGHNFSTTLLYEPDEKWRVGIESSFIAGQVDENFAPVKNYVLFAAMFQYNIGKLSLVLNGENLADFKQSKYGKIYSGSIDNPVFQKLWAPIDGRVINLSAKWSL